MEDCAPRDEEVIPCMANAADSIMRVPSAIDDMLPVCTLLLVCRVQSTYEHHKDEFIHNSDQDAPGESKLLRSQDAVVLVPRATFKSTGILTDSDQPKAQESSVLQALPKTDTSEIPGTF
jgi:hypothetical protein